MVAAFQLMGSVGAQKVQIHPSDPFTRVPLEFPGFALLALGPMMLIIRHVRPVLAMWGAIIATLVYIHGGYAYGPVFLSPVILIFNAVVRGHRRAAWIASGCLFAWVMAYMIWVVGKRPLDWTHHAGLAAGILVVLTVAEVVRTRREQRAERERTEEEESRRQASEERLTMAQELHDVLGHSISLIHVQASTALHLMDEHPEQARTALTTIKQASKDVLTEMRSVLGVLREGAPRSPTAGLAQFDELIARSGPSVVKKIVGRARPLPPGVERAAYRIVQEALTNVTKHAPGARATVTLMYGGDVLTIRVDDTGATAPSVFGGEGGGNGVPGMRERAAALGGSLYAGPLYPGFRVEARLPVPPVEGPDSSEDTE
ncbi:two-component sensor histidine kinase [Sphaerisporangium siamense]|uniref:histidine kinase n=1 Tax=Sphaerisporangium siamense TaxID=795645 RepID=A0A7W7DFC0_9ACTN|nr:histidine kinase [Sphaerisporangium siamense]MBB4705777.1 signal transduction histidine kinase [Sphaerisporangium siamense]GII82836.1 two-component sensor histidine kinase [Sphaerisporangium siamense]